MRTCRRLFRRPAAGGEGERGAATLELVVLFPALLLLVLTIVQAGLFFYARTLALAAAQEGVRAGRAQSAEPRRGVKQAHEFLAATAEHTLYDVAVSAAGSSPAQVRIQVTGRAPSVLPGVPGLPVSQEARGPRERFTSRQRP